MTPRFILAVTDFSAHGHHVLDRAALLSAEHGATLRLAYLACPGETPPADAARRLARHASQLSADHGIEAVACPHLAMSVDDLRADVKAVDLVVWGTAPARGLRAFFAGQPVMQLLRTARRPVLIARQPAHQAHSRLLVAVDLTKSSAPLVEMSLSFSAQASVDLFHAIDTATERKLRHADVSDRAIKAYREQCRQHARERLTWLIEGADERHDRVTWDIGHGEPARLIVQQQQRGKADLIVVGRQPASVLLDLAFGSMGSRILSESSADETPADLLVVPDNWLPGVMPSTAPSVPRRATRRVRAGRPEAPLGPNPASMRG